MLVLMSPTPVTHPAFIPVVVAFVLGLSLLMVSNLPYPSFKGVNLRSGVFAHHAHSPRPFNPGHDLHPVSPGCRPHEEGATPIRGAHSGGRRLRCR
jgi:hypothetical protein